MDPKEAEKKFMQAMRGEGGMKTNLDLLPEDEKAMFAEFQQAILSGEIDESNFEASPLSEEDLKKMIAKRLED